MICVTKGTECGQLKFFSERKPDKVDRTQEKMKRWAFLKSFFDDRSKVIYQKPYLGEGQTNIYSFIELNLF